VILKNYLKILAIILIGVCGNAHAMDVDVPAASSESTDDRKITIRCGGWEFDLPITVAQKLPRCDQEFLAAALISGVDIILVENEIKITPESIELFKNMLAADREEVTGLLQQASVAQLTPLVWLFDYFMDNFRAEQVVQALAEKMAQSDFLREYLNELINLPECSLQKLKMLMLSKLNLMNSQCLKVFTTDEEICCMVLSSEGKLITESNEWDLVNDTCVEIPMPKLGLCWRMVLTPDGQLITGSMDGEIDIWDVKSGTGLKRLEEHMERISCMVLLPDNRTLIVGSGGLTGCTDGGDEIRTWDIKTGQSLKKFVSRFLGEVSDMVLMKDGRLIVSHGMIVKVWNTQTCECLNTFYNDGPAIEHMAVTSKGLLIGSHGNIIRTWKMPMIQKNKKIISLADSKVLGEHADDIHSMMLAMDETTVITGSRDKTVKIWDVRSGKCLRTLEGHENTIWSMALTLDGKVITGSSDHTIRIWGSPIPEIEKLSLEQLLLVLKLEHKCISLKQAMQPGVLTLFNSLPEATQNWFHNADPFCR